eukprot:78123-Rhodomonas_salina.2
MIRAVRGVRSCGTELCYDATRPYGTELYYATTTYCGTDLCCYQALHQTLALLSEEGRGGGGGGGREGA